MKKIALLFCIFIMCTPSVAHACLGPMSHTQTFLLELPEDALSKSIVAKIKIQSIAYEKFYRLSDVKVIKAIQGVELDQIIKVQSQMHSCAQDFDVKKRQKYYIAGTLNEDGIFTGEWSGYITFSETFEKIESQ